MGYSPWGRKESDTTERLQFTLWLLPVSLQRPGWDSSVETTWLHSATECSGLVYNLSSHPWGGLCLQLEALQGENNLMPNLANLPRACLSCDHLTSAMVHRLREEPGSCSPLQPVSPLIPSWFSQLLSDPSSHTLAHVAPSACFSPCLAGCSWLCGTWLGHQNLTPGPLLNPQPGPLTGKMARGQQMWTLGIVLSSNTSLTSFLIFLSLSLLTCNWRMLSRGFNDNGQGSVLVNPQ